MVNGKSTTERTGWGSEEENGRGKLQRERKLAEGETIHNGPESIAKSVTKERRGITLSSPEKNYSSVHVSWQLAMHQGQQE